MTPPMTCKHCGGYGCNLCTPDARKHGKTLQGELGKLKSELLRSCEMRPEVEAEYYRGQIQAMSTIADKIDMLLSEFPL